MDMIIMNSATFRSRFDDIILLASLKKGLKLNQQNPQLARVYSISGLAWQEKKYFLGRGTTTWNDSGFLPYEEGFICVILGHCTMFFSDEIKGEGKTGKT